MKLFRDSKGKLEYINSDPFKLEKEIQTLLEDNVEEVFELEFVKSEMIVDNFRLDTLCFDPETRSFVVVEYKKGSSYSVVDQGYTYLSILLNNKSDFILEYNEQRGGSLRRDEVDWSQSRVIFVSPKFNDYQIQSVNFGDIPFELWEIKRYTNGTVSLTPIRPTSRVSVQNVQPPDRPGNSVEVQKEVKVYSEDYHFDRMSDKSKELYFKLREILFGWDDISIESKKVYVSFSNDGKNFLYVHTNKKSLRLDMVKNKWELNDPHSPFKEVDYGSHSVYSFNLTSLDQIDTCLPSIKEKYLSVKS
jgi:predicted transport protein